jgi:hypothetical protein
VAKGLIGNLSHFLRSELGVEAGAWKSCVATGYGILFKSRPLVTFGLCVMLFHLVSAALLPLVGQKLAAAFPEEATAMMSACIDAAQAVMMPIALLVGRTADSGGRKPLFLVGFAILPIRRCSTPFLTIASGWSAFSTGREQLSASDWPDGAPPHCNPKTLRADQRWSATRCGKGEQPFVIPR